MLVSLFLLLVAVVLCSGAPAAAIRSVERGREIEHGDLVTPLPSHSASYTLNNHRQLLTAALAEALSSDPSWLLGCIAGGQYSLEMTIAGQGPFLMLFDTGSSTTGLLSTLCTSTTDCGSDLGDRLNVSQALQDGRLKGPYSNTSVTYGTNGFWGPLFDATLSLTGAPPSLDTVNRLVAIETAWNFLNSSWYCPTDSHSHGRDVYQGIIGAGLPATLSGQGDTEWVLDFFNQHPDQPREMTYELCPVDAGRLWMGHYDGTETFACSPVVGMKRRWTIQACSASFTSHVNKSTIPLADMADFGVCGSAGDADSCALVDSGVPYAMVPDPIYQSFVSALRSDPAYIAAFGTTNDPFDPSNTYPLCATTNVSIHELRRLLPTVHIQLSNSSAIDGNGTCTANYTVALPGVDGYLSRHSAPGVSPQLYCVSLYSSGENPGSFTHFTVLGDALMQTHVVKHVFNTSADQAPQICFAPSKGCEERDANGYEPHSRHHVSAV